MFTNLILDTNANYFSQNYSFYQNGPKFPQIQRIILKSGNTASYTINNSYNGLLQDQVYLSTITVVYYNKGFPLKNIYVSGQHYFNINVLCMYIRILYILQYVLDNNGCLMGPRQFVYYKIVVDCIKSHLNEFSDAVKKNFKVLL